MRPWIPQAFALAVSAAMAGCAAHADPQDPATSTDGGTHPRDGGGSRDSDNTDPDPPDSSETEEAEVLSPMAVGAMWTYDVSEFGSFPVCNGGIHTAEILAAVEVAGKSAFEVQSWCAAAGTSTMAAEGERVFIRYAGAWVTVLDTPIEEGHTWSSFNTSYTWKSAGTVTVPAGTFDDCWTAEQNVAYTAFTTYCRGVGAVRSVSSDLGGNGWDAELMSYSLPQEP